MLRRRPPKAFIRGDPEGTKLETRQQKVQETEILHLHLHEQIQLGK